MYKQFIEKKLEGFFENPATKLEEAAGYALLSGGKRLRPLLVLATTEALGGPLDAALQPACALECIHTYSLIHDDLPCMDDDDYRRGRLTVHKKFDEATALLAGDLLLTYAFELLSTSPNLSPSQIVELVRVLSTRGGLHGMIGGQFLDIEAEKKPISLEDLKTIYRLKTGELLKTAIEFGAIISDASPEVRQELTHFGEEVGLAFQIMDDVIDVTASKEKHGKEISSDVINGKTTFTSLLGIEGAKSQAFSLLKNAHGRLDTLKLDSPVLLEITTSLVHRNI